MISIQFQGTLEEVHKEMQGFLSGGPPAGKEQKQTKTVEKSVEVTTADHASPKTETTVPKAEPPTDQLAEIKAIIPKLVKVKGRPAVVELLAEFGATSGGEIKEADQATFLTKAKSLIPA